MLGRFAGTTTNGPHCGPFGCIGSGRSQRAAVDAGGDGGATGPPSRRASPPALVRSGLTRVAPRIQVMSEVDHGTMCADRAGNGAASFGQPSIPAAACTSTGPLSAGQRTSIPSGPGVCQRSRDQRSASSSRGTSSPCNCTLRTTAPLFSRTRSSRVPAGASTRSTDWPVAASNDGSKRTRSGTAMASAFVAQTPVQSNAGIGRRAGPPCPTRNAPRLQSDSCDNGLTRWYCWLSGSATNSTWDSSG